MEAVKAPVNLLIIVPGAQSSTETFLSKLLGISILLMERG